MVVVRPLPVNFTTTGANKEVVEIEYRFRLQPFEYLPLFDRLNDAVAYEALPLIPD